MGPRRAGCLAGAIAILALLVAPAWPGATGVALAHAHLVASSPGAGEVLDEPPAELRLAFSERLEAQVTSLDIRAADGTLIVERGGRIDPEDPYALVLELPGLDEGVYTVTWRTLSADDGHTAQGLFSFAIGDGQIAVPGAGHGSVVHTDPDPLRVIGRWLTYAGLLLAFGMAAFHAVVIRAGPMPAALRRLLATGLAVAAAATLAVAVGAAAEADAFPGYLVETRTGLLHVARAGVAVAGGAALMLVSGRAATPVAATAGLAGIVVLVSAGHAAALPGPVPIVGHAVHVAGAAIWMSGVVALLALTLRPSLLTQGVPPELRTVVPRFSALALVSIGLVGLTGIYAAWSQLGSLPSPDADYGRTLIVKVLLAGGAMAIGGLNYLEGGRMLRRLPPLRGRLAVETGGAAAVLLATALLAITPPLEEAAGVPIEPIPDAFGAVAPGMGLAVAPGRPGVNRVTVTTTDALAMAARLELSLDRLDEGTTTRVPLVTDDGMDHGGTAAPADGEVSWSADALVLPAGSTWDLSVRVLLPADDREVNRQRFAFTVSDEGIASGERRTLLDPGTLAGLLLLLGGGVGLVLALGRVRLPRTEATASRAALLGGGIAALAAGAAIGLERLFGA